MTPLKSANKKLVIWGTGREGRAASKFVSDRKPDAEIEFIDEAGDEPTICIAGKTYNVHHQPADIRHALIESALIIKSPGVSLYHPLLLEAKARQVPITSLLNMWFMEPRTAKTICVTGTKGKSTTAALIAHILKALGKKTALAGNIGTPITEVPFECDYIIIEVSSYQAANFEGTPDLSVLTSLYPEHLDWHGSLEAYYRDKLRLFAHAKHSVINGDTEKLAEKFGLRTHSKTISNIPTGIHAEAGTIFQGVVTLGTVSNAHLARSHNLVNLCTALTVIAALGLDIKAALASTSNFEGLPHRQFELGSRQGILYVDDSISTTPQSAIAALAVYRPRPLTIILGGYDRGIDYSPLINYILREHVQTVICMGPSGQRIADGLRAGRSENIFVVETMKAAVACAVAATRPGGVILLSPAAPSYGLFKDFIERGTAFAAESGFISRL